VVRVTLELGDLTGLLVDIGQHPARRLAVEAGGRYQRVAALDSFRPFVGVQLDVVVPVIGRREFAKSVTAVARVFAVEVGYDAQFLR
jgi:hypothetical protein